MTDGTAEALSPAILELEPDRGASLLPEQINYALLLAVLTAVAVDLSLAWLFWPDYFAADFHVFWRGARELSPYAWSQAPFGNPPTALLFFQPLRLLPFWPAFALWTIAGFALFLRFGSRLYGRRAALLGAISPAAALAIVGGQTSLVVGALVFAAFLSGPVACGVLLGIGACLKPQMLFLAPLLFLFAREFRALAALSATVLLCIVLATAVFGLSIWSDWSNGMHNLLAVAGGRGALYLTISPLTYSPWLGLLCLPLAGIGLYLCRDLPRGHKAAAVVAASLFASPYALYYDLAPLAVFAAVPILRSSDWRSFSAVLSYSAALGPLSVPALWPSMSAADESDRSTDPVQWSLASRALRGWRPPGPRRSASTAAMNSVSAQASNALEASSSGSRSASPPR